MTTKLVLDSSIDKDQVRVLLFGADLSVVAEMTFEFTSIATAIVETNTSHDVELKVSFYDERSDVTVYLGDADHGIISGMALVTTAVAREIARIQAVEDAQNQVNNARREGLNEGHEKGWAAASRHYDDLIPTLRYTARQAGFRSGYDLGYTTSELEWLVLLTSFPL